MSEITLQMRDWRTGDGHDDEMTVTDRKPWNVTVKAERQRIDVTAKAPDGTDREVWIEISEGNLVVHCYDPDHDEPLNVRIGADAITTDDDRDHIGIAHHRGAR